MHLILLVAALWGEPVSAEIARAKPCSTLLESKPKESTRHVVTVSLNAQDFDFSGGKFSKTPEQMRIFAQTLLRRDADHIVLQEVMSRAALIEFNRRYLGDRYEVYMTEPTPHQFHSIGFLIKKGHGYIVKIQSNRKMVWFDPVEGRERYLFHHDAPALMFFKQGEPRAPKKILLGHHGKSKRHRAGDNNSHLLRAAQIRGLLTLVDEYKQHYGEQVPIIVVGDFNTDVRNKNNDEMLPLRLDMSDAFDIAGVDSQQRITYVYHSPINDRNVQLHQLDGFFTSESLRNRIVAAGVDRYQESAAAWDRSDPSDHRPLWIVTEED